MIELQDITLKEYIELEDKTEYDFAIKYAKSLYNEALDIFNSGDFTLLEFGLIKDLQLDLAEGIGWSEILDYIERITGKHKKDLVNYKLLTLSRYKSYMIAEIERINEIETQLLSYVATSDEKNAGIDEFNQFGSYGQLRKLANEDVTKLDQVRKLKYSDCLLELYYQKVNYEFQDSLFKIKSKKH